MNANPIMVRLAWHDSGTYDKEVRAAADPRQPDSAPSVSCRRG